MVHGLPIGRKFRSAFRRSGLLLALAAFQLTWFVPTANGQVPWPSTPAPSTESSTSATGESPQSPTEFGIAPMEHDPASRAVLAGTSVGNMTYHNGPVQHTQRV